MTWRRRLMLVCLVMPALGLGGLAFAQEELSADEVEAPAVDAAPAERPADEVLRQMLDQRRDRPVIQPDVAPSLPEPAGAPTRGTRIDVDERVVGVAPGHPRPSLLREGQFIPRRRGRLVRAPGSSQFLLVFEADEAGGPAEPPMFVLPCKALESMEQYIAERGDRAVFSVPGQVFTYRGGNYLLPTMSQWSVDAQNVAANPPPVVEAPPAADGAAMNGEMNGDEPDEAERSAEDVLAEMLRQRRDRPAGAVEPVTPTPATPSPARIDERVVGIAPPNPNEPALVLRREGEFIPERRGRLVRAPGTNQFLFVFDADDRQSPEPPMFVMPCRALESMEQHVIDRGDRVVFSIAGHIFTYRGANYLLPTLWRLPPDRGNLQ